MRLRLKCQRVVEEEDFLTDLDWRIRDVRVGPDGYLYVLPDAWGTNAIRLVPADADAAKPAPSLPGLRDGSGAYSLSEEQLPLENRQ